MSDAFGMERDAQFEEIDRQIDALHERLDVCRRAIVMSRAAIWLGGAALVLVVTIAGSYRTPSVVFGAIAAVLGGTVWFGANKTSRDDIEQQLADAEGKKAQLFDEVATHNGWRDMTPTVH